MRNPSPAFSPAPLGSRLLGWPTESLLLQRIRVQLIATTLLVLANVMGTVLAIVLMLVVLPRPNLLVPEFATVNFVILPAYIAGSFAIAGIVGTRMGLAANRWHFEGRQPNAEESIRSLKLPRRLTLLQAVCWLGATGLFTVAAIRINPDAVPKLFFGILFTGMIVCVFSFQLAEFALRAVAAIVIETGAVQRDRLPRVMTRVAMGWGVACGLPLIGIIITAATTIWMPTRTEHLAQTVAGLAVVGLVIGIALTTLMFVFGAAPVRSVTDAMLKITEGELDTHVVVYDATELGQLQSGFNRMAEGLRERERIHDLFGRHVGRDVAAEAVRRNPTLGGQEREVAVFFLDLVGSTRLAATRPPTEVVAILNRVFDVVVAEVDAHDGFINKFEGDAALAVFGAPLDLDDAAGQALAAARVISRRLRAEVTELAAGIGVSFGTAVAGNIGARDRFEYTVIGDPINEAARLCDLAKNYESRLVASAAVLAAAGAAESAYWELGESVLLRGRIEETQLAFPLSTPVDNFRP